METKWVVQLSCQCWVFLPDPKPGDREAMICVKHQSDPARNLTHPVVWSHVARYDRNRPIPRGPDDPRRTSWVQMRDGRLQRDLSNEGRAEACWFCYLRAAKEDIGDMHTGTKPACLRCYYGQSLEQSWRHLRDLPRLLFAYAQAWLLDR